jgi:prepilin-type N-terminal cleavage/methylation domain-containing protein
MATHSPSNPRVPTPIPSNARVPPSLPSNARVPASLSSKPEAQARECPLRDCPARDSSARLHSTRPRSGFTLVELLVVIGIIAMLAALVTPAVMRAQATARNAAIKAEIDMLHMAIMNYKNEYGSFPPCAGSGPAVSHISRLFPRCPNQASQVQTQVTPANALVGWLGGYTNDPTRPVIGSAEDTNYNLQLDSGEDTNGNNLLDPLPRQKLFDFDTSRVNTATGMYAPAGRPQSPYIYISKSEYGNAWPSSNLTYTLSGKTYTIYANTFRALMRTGSEYFNNDTFQILCAGRDGVWSEDHNGNNVLDIGEDVNGNNVLDKSDDDLSNFWSGTRKDYLDSLKQ